MHIWKAAQQLYIFIENKDSQKLKWAVFVKSRPMSLLPDSTSHKYKFHRILILNYIFLREYCEYKAISYDYLWSPYSSSIDRYFQVIIKMPPKATKAPNPIYVPTGKTKKPRKEIDYDGFQMPEVTESEVIDFADTGSDIIFKGGLPDNIHHVDLYNSGKYSDFTLECNGKRGQFTKQLFGKPCLSQKELCKRFW